MSDWQPIETAPRDGTHILVWVPHEDPWAQTAYYKKLSPAQNRGMTWSGWLDTYEGVDLFPPSHWQPLPEPPEEFENIRRRSEIADRQHAEWAEIYRLLYAIYEQGKPVTPDPPGYISPEMNRAMNTG